MKLICSLFATCMISVASRLSIDLANTDLPADSEIGMTLMSKARRVEENYDYEYGKTWLSGYSIKFLGCHQIQQWNDEAEDKEDIRIKNKRLVRFRLCPSHECTSHNAGGCLDQYGDYIIDLLSFMEAYFEITRQASKYECEQYYLKNCDCEDDEENDDNSGVGTCGYDCYAEAGLEKSCVDQDPNGDDDSSVREEFDPERYMECAKYQFNNQAGDDDAAANRRDLEEGEDKQALYIGPFCRHQGGSVMLGAFTDDTCSQFADEDHGRDTFKALSGGMELPYSEISLIPSRCVACINQEITDGENDDYDQSNTVLDTCLQIYSEAGKCEKEFGDDIVDMPNNKACSYIRGVKYIRNDGIATGSSGPNGTVNIFIVFFALTCAALGHYIQYLRKILKHKAIAQALLPAGSFTT